MKEKGVEIIRNASIQLAIAFPFIWFALLTVQALREQSTGIYFAMGWLAIPCAFLIASDALIRFVKIDFESRTVHINDGIGISTPIHENTLLKVTNWKGIYTLTFSENGMEKNVRWLAFYTSSNQKRILKALKSFNPQVVGL